MVFNTFPSALIPSTFLLADQALVYSTGEIQVPKKSAPKLTTTLALSKLYDGINPLSSPNEALLAIKIPLYPIAS